MGVETPVPGFRIPRCHLFWVRCGDRGGCRLEAGEASSFSSRLVIFSLVSRPGLLRGCFTAALRYGMWILEGRRFRSSFSLFMKTWALRRGLWYARACGTGIRFSHGL